jgi:RNA-binding motif X-linked protein 2
VEDINLVREEDTGKSRGFAFVKYEDSRSCILAVDNFAGTKVLGRSIRVDHCEKYRLPKELLEKEEKARTDPGHAYQGKEFANDFSIQQGQDLFARPPATEHEESKPLSKEKREERKEAKRKQKEERHQRRQDRAERRQRKEEKRREKRARHFLDDDDDQRETKKKKRKRYDSPGDS